jgi:hypothetical protein
MELPQEFNSYPQNEKDMINNALKVILSNQEYIDFVIDKDNSLKNGGFMSSKSKYITEIGTQLLNDGHSGASFACTMRNCQYILKNYYENMSNI